MANEFIIKNGFQSKGNSGVTGSVMILSEDTPGVRVVSNNDNSEEVKIYDAKMTIEDSGSELITLSTNVQGSRLGTLQLANWTANLVGVYLNGYSDNFYANWIGGALIVGRSYSLSTFQHHVALDVSGSAVVTGSLDVTGDITGLDLNLTGGDIDLKNAGAQSNIKFYCESSNAHHTKLQAAAHSDYSGDVTTTLPAYNFDFKTPTFATDLKVTGEISASGDIVAQGDITASAFKGDGSQLTNLPSSNPFPFTGDAQITGSLIVSGSFIPLGKATDDSNVIIGKDAAPNITSTSGQNVLIGKEAGGTGTLNNADSNVCIGYQAGYELDGGDNNIAIGNQAGYLMDGPTGTVAIGAQVMRDAINNYGTGLGHYAGRFQKNNPNTLVGANAGYGVSGQSDARYNSCFGYRAGYLLRDGYYNTILGDDAGYSINNGYGNVFIGSNSGYNVTDGTGNIIIGSGSLGVAAIDNQLRIGNGDSLTTISASLLTGDIILQNTTVTELTTSKISIPETTADSQDLASNTQYSVNGTKVEVRAITAAQVNNSLRFEFKLLNTSIETNSIVLGSFTGNHANSDISGSIISVATIAANTASVFIHNETGGNIQADTPFTASFIVL